MAFLPALRRTLWAGTLAFALAAFAIGLWPASEDLPWAPLDLDRPVGPFTPAKLAALDGAPADCKALLAQAGVAYRALADRGDGGACRIDGAVAWRGGGTRDIAYRPAAPTLACPLAAALVLWERQVVQPQAVRLLGARVRRIDHYGSYACRRIAGGEARAWSEHARAAAIDVAGFVLADGRRVTVARDWAKAGAAGAFLHAVRDGGCRIFATTLSPDYNAAHRDHLHLDEARRGGWAACR